MQAPEPIHNRDDTQLRVTLLDPNGQLRTSIDLPRHSMESYDFHRTEDSHHDYLLAPERDAGYGSDLESHSSLELNRMTPTTDSDSAKKGVTVAEEEIKLPAKRQGKIVRDVRFLVFDVYRRLFTIVFLANLIGFFVLLFTSGSLLKDNIAISHIATASSANILVSIMIRQDYVINTMYHLCWRLPHSLPLAVRCFVAKSHEYGGIHSGML